MTLDSLDSRDSTDSTVRDLLDKDASLKFEVIGDGIYQIDGFGTYGHWTCLVEVADSSVKIFSYFPVEVNDGNVSKMYEFICRNNARFGNGFIATYPGTSLVWFRTSAHSTNGYIPEDIVYTAINDNLTTTDLLLPAVVYVCEEPQACVAKAMKMVEYCMTEYIARSISNQSEDPVIVV